MQGKDETEIRDEILRLTDEHRTLDEEIMAQEASGTADQLVIRRLKKRKLMLKDRVSTLEDQLLPDIIA